MGSYIFRRYARATPYSPKGLEWLNIAGEKGKKKKNVNVCVYRVMMPLPGYSGLVSDTLRFVHGLI